MAQAGRHYRHSRTTFTLSYLIAEGSAPTCLDAADANDDGGVDFGDGVYIHASRVAE
jgi:hypothetical protein